MPGYVIHLAVGKVYLCHNKISDVASFEKGIVAPDMEKDKAKSHFGPYSSQPNLNSFINSQGLSTDYDEGYFLHLLTDYLFYNKFLKTWSQDIYDDYDRLNARIIEKYGIRIADELQSVVRFKEGNLGFLNEDSLYRFIDTVGKIDVRGIVSEKGDFKRRIDSEVMDREIDC